MTLGCTSNSLQIVKLDILLLQLIAHNTNYFSLNVIILKGGEVKTNSRMSKFMMS